MRAFFVTLLLVMAGVAAPAQPAAAAVPAFTDGYGREIVLRGFNVSGSTKLYASGC
ncbi:hypothetical protein [Actinoplanes flavus]|uniref:Uncharacterized protein n=1 Tax=Actinoplanes flavus TaxID=2820290 RepID=A0ABS3UXS5_9ACTN|nr:hypothetical protein [Actinoplanes flavus]MBO3743382.1 hypothetical protein [Actinoplanes flavus]